MVEYTPVSSYIGHALGTDEDAGWLTVVASYVLEPSDQELRKGTGYAWTQTRRLFLNRIAESDN